MVTPRRLGLFVAGMAFRSLLFLTIVSSAAVTIAGTSSHLKSALVQSKAYDRFVPSIIEANIAQSQGTGSIPFDEPAIQKIINESFPASSLQIHAETVIDSIYVWLHKQTPQPTFTVDLTSNKQQLANNLSQYAVDRLAKQPVCTVLPININPFSDTCQPAGFDPVVQQPGLARQIYDSPGLLPKTIFTAADLPKVRSGATITERYSYAPRLFGALVWTPWVSGGLLVITTLALLFLNRTKREAALKIGFEVMSNGLLFMASPLIFGYLMPMVTKNLDLPTSGGGTQAVVNDAIKFYSGYFDSFFLNIGFYTALIGVLGIGLARFLRTNQGYHDLANKAGVLSSNAPRAHKGKVILTADTIPIQSSEVNAKMALQSRVHSKKYRTIPTEEL